jgi:hypothetical protein
MARDIPADVRAQVDERDRRHCRFCGRQLGHRRIMHHIRYGGDEVGMGGPRYHHVDNIITLCGTWDGDCHMKVHSNKKLWQPILEALIEHNLQYMTALAYRRQQRERAT